MLKIIETLKVPTITIYDDEKIAMILPATNSKKLQNIYDKILLLKGTFTSVDEISNEKLGEDYVVDYLHYVCKETQEKEYYNGHSAPENYQIMHWLSDYHDVELAKFIRSEENQICLSKFDFNTGILTLAKAIPEENHNYVYGLVYGRGQDEGYGDYSSPIFSEPISYEGDILIIKNEADAKEVATILDQEAETTFYSVGQHENYDGYFPIEYKLIRIPTFSEVPESVFSSKEEVLKYIKLMHSSNWAKYD